LMLNVAIFIKISDLQRAERSGCCPLPHARRAPA
jgi:hypothetical protein